MANAEHGFSRVNALCVISRAREAAAERGGNLAPAAERGAAFFCFGLSAVVRAAPAPAVSATTSYRVGSSARPIDRLVVWAALTRFVSFPAHARRQPSAVAIWPRRRSGVRLFSVSVYRRW